MEGVVLKIFFCLLFGGFALTADDAGDMQGGIPLPADPSLVYNPVNSITINTCSNSSEEEDINFKKQLNEIKTAITHLVYTLRNGAFCHSEDGEEPPISSTPNTPIEAKDCFDIYQNGETTSGVYTITPEGSPSIEVYCDMDTAGGGWTVVQRRVDASVDFYLNWNAYKTGFGSLEGNHWLGNENLYFLSNQKRYGLRVDLEDFEDETRYAAYDYFRITDETDKYTLTLGNYSGDAGDAMAICNGQRFSTRDDDNGNDCPSLYYGGWWYRACHEANLNGRYLSGVHTIYASGIEWYQWKGYFYSLKFTEMKLRPT